MRNLLTLLPLLALTGCEEAVDSASFDLTFMTKNWIGADVDCKINTSYPENDPQRGKFYVSAADNADQEFSVLVSFLGHEAAPPAGDYDIATELHVQATFMGLSGSLVRGDFSEGGTVTVTDDLGLVVSFDGTGTLSGEIVCP